jgi:hypothetical protein
MIKMAESLTTFDWKIRVLESLFNGYDGVKTVYNVFLVNVWTLIRNALNHKEDNTLFQTVIDDFQILYESFLYRDSNIYPQNKLVAFYIPKAYFVPPEFQKSINISTSKIIKYGNWFYENIVEEIRETKTFHNSIFLEYVKLPYIAEPMYMTLLKYLASKKSIIGSIYDTHTAINICMLSHIPLDWLIYDTCMINVQYLESYTGKIHTSQNLMSKILSKDILKRFPGIDEQIPFNHITHLLFGDRYFVKGLLSKKEQRSIILVLLEDYRHDPWRWIKDLNNLLSDLQHYLCLSPTMIMTLKNQGGTQVL